MIWNLHRLRYPSLIFYTFGGVSSLKEEVAFAVRGLPGIMNDYLFPDAKSTLLNDAIYHDDDPDIINDYLFHYAKSALWIDARSTPWK